MTLLNLPPEILAKIYRNPELSVNDLNNNRLVNHALKEVTESDDIWREKCVRLQAIDPKINIENGRCYEIFKQSYTHLTQKAWTEITYLQSHIDALAIPNPSALRTQLSAITHPNNSTDSLAALETLETLLNTINSTIIKNKIRATTNPTTPES